MSAREKIKSVHILSDVKFLPWIKRTFSIPGWNAYYILLNDQERKVYKDLGEDALEVSSDSFGESIVVERLKAFDIAFHYLLNNTKAEIIRKSGKDVIHCWCFYGAEIYQQTNLFRNTIYGPQTRKMLRTLPEKRFRYELRKWYYSFWKREPSPISSLRRAISKIYAILWYVEEEMELINQKIKLPPCSFFQFFSFNDIIPPGTAITDVSSKRILIGNSATIENNHADVLPLLTSISDPDYTFSLPLTYGQFSRYKAKIKAMYKRKLKDRVTFLEEHLTLKEYYALLQKHPTAIFLHYRQQGLGNILYLLYNGTKVYVSQHTVVYQWLKKNGVEVFIFEEDFLKDAQAQRLTLEQTTIAHNQRKIRELLDHQKNDLTIAALEEEVYSRKKRIANDIA
jgi:hypothetical protein